MTASASPRIVAGDLALAQEGDALVLRHAVRGHHLAVIPCAGLGAPWLGGVRAPLQVAAVAWSGDAVTVEQAAPGVRATLRVRALDCHLEWSGRIAVAEACELNRVDLLPAGTRLNLWDVVNFRNRHGSVSAWPELSLGQQFATDTYSTDWQFAPHPAMMVLRRDREHLLWGALGLCEAFGLHLKVARHRVEHAYLDHGPAGHGLALAAGAAWELPPMAMLLDGRGDVEATIGRWTGLLVARGAIPDPARRTRHAWHREPLYCTWIDQCARAEVTPPSELSAQVAAAAPAVRALDQELVRAALAVIRRERLPIRTVLLDEGWAAARGDWRAHPQRFPDLRGLVDEIHAAGMKAVVWWGWPEIAKDAAVDPALLVAGGRLNRHGARLYDFASPAVQRGYLEPLFRRLFSSAPGCYDLDGVKTDFIADKVHPDMPPGDPAWRGEENYFARFYALFTALMRRHKPDACHIGCAGHPWLAEHSDINRTFDVFGADVREHACRGAMLRATSPGCPVALDFHNHLDGLEDWFALGHREGWSFQLGNLLYMRRDPISDWEPADAAFHQRLRRGLAGG